jgi:hypothetical protein
MDTEIIGSERTFAGGAIFGTEHASLLLLSHLSILGAASLDQAYGTDSAVILTLSR